MADHSANTKPLLTSCSDVDSNSANRWLSRDSALQASKETTVKLTVEQAGQPVLVFIDCHFNSCDVNHHVL